MTAKGGAAKGNWGSDGSSLHLDCAGGDKTK